MMITEHNYEEYFLLYIDNELNAAGRKAVEDFVACNPQHKALFNALQETKLPADESFTFVSKQDLYKDETSDIGINNYEEYFLLYTDNELSEKEKETTERFVLQHPQLQEEFVLLQQTKLTPEVIEYKNKEELYKKERRVLPIYIAAMCVAAALFAVLFFSGVFISHKNLDTNLAATLVHPIDESSYQSQKISVSPEAVDHPKEQTQTNAPTDQPIKNTVEKTNTVATNEQTNRNSFEAPITAQSHQPNEEVAVSPVHEDRQTAQVSIPDNHAVARQASVLKPLEEFEPEQTNATTALSLTDNNTAEPAVYKELNTDEDNNTLYVSGLPINKNKVNGFLKSASRLLGGHAKQGEE